MIAHILMDLDGTIIESGPNILKAAKYALAKMDTQPPPDQVLNQFIGPPLQDSFINIIGFTPEQAEQATWLFREYYTTQGLLDNPLYPGIDTLIQTLPEQGFTLHLATSKPIKFAKKILEHAGLAPYFNTCHGSRMDESGPPKPQIIAQLLEENPQINPHAAIMIGDRSHDIEAANANHLSSIGVLYGYGSRQELEQAGASYIANTVEDLLPLLLQLKGTH